jgi:hypothetical protein
MLNIKFIIYTVLGEGMEKGSRHSSHSLRPPSYSDSFLYLPPSINGDTFTIEPLNHQKTLASFDDLTVEPEAPQNSHYTYSEKWYNRFMGFGVHILLLSLFETIFFFKYVSESENAGLQKTVDGYVNGILVSCGNWSTNTTILVNDVLTLFLNATDIQEKGLYAYTVRTQYNNSLELQAWMYVLGLFVLVIGGSFIGYRMKMRLAWRRIVIDNMIMIGLLGIYEWTFFKTIIYNYDNLSLAELNEFIVNQLENTCGLL